MYFSHEEYADLYTLIGDQWITDKLLPKIVDQYKSKTNPESKQTKRRCMIIGPGPAPTIDPIIKYFDEFILIEPNQIFRNKYKSSIWYKKCIKLNKKVTVIPSTIEDLFLNINDNKDASSTSEYKFLRKNTIDLIISTHVAYYFPNEYMTNIMAFLLSLLTQNTGILSIGVDDDDLDITVKLTKKAEPKYKCSKLIENSLNNLNIKYTKSMEYNEYKFDNIDDTKQSLEFFIYEAAFNKNWFHGNRLTKEQKQRVDNIISDGLKHDSIKDEEGIYILPNYTVHYIVDMTFNHQLPSKL